jgi:NADPH-dependent curcumin reductase CurA
MSSWQDSVRTAGLLGRSTSVMGFLLTHYVSSIPVYAAELIKLVATGEFKVRVDVQRGGMAGIVSAVEYLHVRV